MNQYSVHDLFETMLAAEYGMPSSELQHLIDIPVMSNVGMLCLHTIQAARVLLDSMGLDTPSGFREQVVRGVKDYCQILITG